MLFTKETHLQHDGNRTRDPGADALGNFEQDHLRS